jgi:purine-binding chemotaxis protein CheW
MASRAASEPEGVMQLACVEARGQVYGLDVHQVREIVRRVPATPLPRAPAVVEGLVELRGGLLPLVDLGRMLGGEPGPIDAAARIAVVEVDGLGVALRVDAVLDVVAVDAAEVAEAPALGGPRLPLRGVVRRADGSPVLVLSLEELLAGLREDPATRAGAGRAGAESPEEDSR